MTQLLTERRSPAPEKAKPRARTPGPARDSRRLGALAARAERLANAESELNRLGEQIDALRGRSEPIPQRLREELREAGRRRLGLRWSE